MSKYQILKSKGFKTDFKKLSKEDKKLTLDIIKRLANDEVLEPIYKDHALQGRFKGYRDCHVKNDLVLIYEKDKNILTLTCINIANHSNSFKK
ncbi:toxin-antitoxin system, toxin component, YafQ family [Campylobacter sp. RM5004]|uniref:type II toxin-antitoxin system YafQ family toxin n=1 Tax=Campylobacter sp. RM5004 TaxID=1660078 RepID=UPI001EFA2BB1|nr:type II toxin-antitoxin system YafQ family toxin [Campylobacter sp. RM5004]ULO02425.1 toxin-antitoxin system, toxin component, YafQ family [Campylobacter sp. RM5004]